MLNIHVNILLNILDFFGNHGPPYAQRNLKGWERRLTGSHVYEIDKNQSFFQNGNLLECCHRTPKNRSRGMIWDCKFLSGQVMQFFTKFSKKMSGLLTIFCGPILSGRQIKVFKSHPASKNTFLTLKFLFFNTASAATKFRQLFGYCGPCWRFLTGTLKFWKIGPSIIIFLPNFDPFVFTSKKYPTGSIIDRLTRFGHNGRAVDRKHCQTGSTVPINLPCKKNILLYLSLRETND